MSELGSGLISFWLAVALALVTLLGAFGWLVALVLARESNVFRRSQRNFWRRFDAQQARLHELRSLNRRLVECVRDASPKATRGTP